MEMFKKTSSEFLSKFRRVNDQTNISYNQPLSFNYFYFRQFISAVI